MADRAYLCDGMGCDEQCALKKTVDEWEKYECHHTLNEAHARNKCRRNRKWVACQDGKLIEKE